MSKSEPQHHQRMQAPMLVVQVGRHRVSKRRRPPKTIGKTNKMMKPGNLRRTPGNGVQKPARDRCKPQEKLNKPTILLEHLGRPRSPGELRLPARRARIVTTGKVLLGIVGMTSGGPVLET